MKVVQDSTTEDELPNSASDDVADCFQDTSDASCLASENVIHSKPTKETRPHSQVKQARGSSVHESDDTPPQKPRKGKGRLDEEKNSPMFVHLMALLAGLLVLHLFARRLQAAEEGLARPIALVVALTRPVLNTEHRLAGICIDLALFAVFASALQHLGECSQFNACVIFSFDGLAALTCVSSIAVLLKLHGGHKVQRILGVSPMTTTSEKHRPVEPKTHSTSDVGVVAMDVYFPQYFVSQSDLEKHDGVSHGKYTAGLGQLNMAVCHDLEDATSMALTVVKSLLRKYNIDPCRIGRIEVGTESLSDYSKSIKTSLMNLFASCGNTDVEGVMTINACYGCTAALLNSTAWVESSAWDGRFALVVASDLASYAPGPARPTGGAGAVAILIGADAVISLEPVRASFSSDVYDFFKPCRAAASEYPVVDGHLANDVYLGALDSSYRSFVAKTEDRTGKRLTLDDLDYCIFHAPYNKLVVRSLARLVFNDFLGTGCQQPSALQAFAHLSKDDDASLHDRDLDIACRKASAAAYQEKTAPSTWLSRQTGNSYTASLYMGLASLISAKHSSQLLGKQLTMFSFGSGAVATMFSLRVRKSTAEICDKMDILARLAARTKISAAAYEAKMQARSERYGVMPFKPTEAPSLDCDVYYLAGIAEQGQRTYMSNKISSESNHDDVDSSVPIKYHFEAHDSYQVALMKEQCIAIDWDDRALGPISKETSHLNALIAPSAGPGGSLLHRAFSVLLFNSKGELLLQQRAAEKITFPLYWANTCCSHPLFTTSELEEIDQLGVKRAAQRKLLHELGIEAAQVPLDAFQFVTRFHYAADSCETWGEHEIDYVLLIQCDVDLAPNPNEVAATQYVTRDTISEILKQSEAGETLLSPWFRLLCETVLMHWWDALEKGVTGNMASDKIYRLMDDDARDQMIAESEARLALALASQQTEESRPRECPPSPDCVNKMPSCGKFSKFSKVLHQLSYPSECWSILKYLTRSKSSASVAPTRSPDEERCFQLLNRTSRSFAAVIEQLSDEMCTAVCVFYLVLRALDTVEDDMSLSHGRKKTLLLDFYTRIDKPGSCRDGILGLGDSEEYRELLRAFDAVTRVVVNNCTAMQQNIIRDITRRMGEGMASFVGKESLESNEEYDLYCHYVAGLVGIGLSQLFAASVCEGPHMAAVGVPDLSNEMGLFLQKTNITRDYLEDVLEGRPWWPRQVWSKYAPSAMALQEPQRVDLALQALNEMVTDALEHAPASMRYLQLLRDPTIFKFCAVPQVMAIATLCEIYNNRNVFTGVVKIRKGLALQLINNSTSCNTVEKTFRNFAAQIRSKIEPSDPSAWRTHAAIDAIMDPPPVPCLLCPETEQKMVRQVLAGDIRLHQLESKLGDTALAVRVRRAVLQEQHRLPVEGIPQQPFDYDAVHGSNCEAVIGFTTLPIGVVGPLCVDGTKYHVPLATTEGALVASTQRGCKAVQLGGVRTELLHDGISRAPLLQFPSAAQAARFASWIALEKSYAIVKEAFESTTKFGKLKEVKARLAGRNVFLRFVCSTGDAMGMNMAGKGCEAALKAVSGMFPDMQVLSLSGNMCADKKASAVNWLEGRGKSVVAEAIIPGEVVRTVLKTSVQAIVNVNTNKNLVGSAMAGALGGFNAHAANIVAALFIATGQDPAQVVESSHCITLMEPTNGGQDLLVSCTMPSIEVGTVGGGTGLAAQQACLRMLGVAGPHQLLPGSNAARLGRIVCAAVLAGEISLVAALSSGDLIRSHMSLNRKGSPTASQSQIQAQETERVPVPTIPISTDAISKEEFMSAFPALMEEVLQHLQDQVDSSIHVKEAEELVSWVRGLLEHAGPGGKMNRGLTVCHTVSMLLPTASPQERHRAIVLGWAVELLQAFFLVADDVMDNSTTRRGKPCWYRLPHVGLKAVNDSFILEACVLVLVKRHLGDSACYPQILDLLHECTLQTELGQCLDLNTEDSLRSSDSDKLVLEHYTLQRVQAIAKHKTAYYSFYLPLAMGMALAGYKEKTTFEAVKGVCMDIGIYFQAQDDFLDCYGDPAVIGKVGTDIESGKCSWLVAEALQRCTPEQRYLIENNYAVDDPSKVAVIKKLYNELNLEEAFVAYEERSYAELCGTVEAIQEVPQEVLHALINKVYKRTK
jgi:3-hydroxy-3-methylglutaryl-CoA-synthase/farnesyl-diphosphate farnesyltransferase/isopentenyl-diphosphate delta-isomerase type 1